MQHTFQPLKSTNLEVWKMNWKIWVSNLEIYTKAKKIAVLANYAQIISSLFEKMLVYHPFHLKN